MGQNKTLGRLVGAMLLAGVAGCSGTGGAGGVSASDPTQLDGDAATVALSFQMVDGTTAAALSTEDSAGNTLDLTAASMTLEEIEIKLPDGQTCAALRATLPDFATCDDSEEDDDKIVLVGPFVVDLLTGESTPSLSDVTLPSGIVREVRLRVESLSVDGTSGGDPVSLRLRINERIDLEDTAGFEISEAVSVNTILLNFNVREWLAGVDLQACDENHDGSVEIDDEDEGGDCSDLEDSIRDNVKASGTVEEHDGSEDDSREDSGDDSTNETDDSGQDGAGDDH